MYHAKNTLITILACVVLNAVLLSALTACSSDAEREYIRSLQLATLTAAPMQATATQVAQAMRYTQTAEAVVAQKAEADQAYIAASLQLTQFAATATTEANATQSAIWATELAIKTTQTAESIRATQTTEARQTAEAQRSTQQAYQTTATMDALNAASTAQSQTIQSTAAAVSAITTQQASIATATAQVIIAIEQRAAIDARTTQMALTVRGQEATNYAIAWSPICAGALLFGFMAFIVIRFTNAELTSKKAIRNQAGELIAVIEERSGKLAVLLPGRSFHPAMLNTKDGIVIPNTIPQLQEKVVQRDQLLQALRTNPTLLASNLNKGLLESAQPEQPALAPDLGTIPAPWDRLNTWNSQTFIIGVNNTAQPITFDPLATPHLLVAGTSGAGKSMTILRPMAAQALAKGYQVVLANDAGGDYAPLGSHPNLIRAGEGAAAAAEILTAVSSEVDRRSAILRTNGTSTWSRLPEHLRGNAAPILLVIDELVALAWEASGEVKQKIWRAVIHITSKGRKMGISFIAGTTDPTERTLGREGLVMRDNCARVALRVLDASVSRVLVLEDGAERLPENQFITVMRGQRSLGLAFHPEDEQIAAYIRTHPVAPLGSPTWMDNKPEIVEGEVTERETDQQKIIRLHNQGLTNRQIEIAVYNYSNGRTAESVKTVLDAAATKSATSRTTTPATVAPTTTP